MEDVQVGSSGRVNVLRVSRVFLHSFVLPIESMVARLAAFLDADTDATEASAASELEIAVLTESVVARLAASLGTDTDHAGALPVSGPQPVQSMESVVG